MPIDVPEGVSVEIQGSEVTVSGPRGQLSRTFHQDMDVSLENQQLQVRRPTDKPYHRSLHGLTRALLANMVHGVSSGFQKKLHVEGVGYRAEMQDDDLVLNVGYSNPVRMPLPEGITVSVEKGYRDLTVEGNDKEVVGEFAAKIRAVRKPEPYKGKGIRYADEWVRRKAGKAGKAI
jgi:large subunit ribosomal protein L6